MHSHTPSTCPPTPQNRKEKQNGSGGYFQKDWRFFCNILSKKKWKTYFRNVKCCNYFSRKYCHEAFTRVLPTTCYTGIVPYSCVDSQPRRISAASHLAFASLRCVSWINVWIFTHSHGDNSLEKCLNDSISDTMLGWGYSKTSLLISRFFYFVTYPVASIHWDIIQKKLQKKKVWLHAF